jgi:hypothetical protein
MRNDLKEEGFILAHGFGAFSLSFGKGGDMGTPGKREGSSIQHLSCPPNPRPLDSTTKRLLKIGDGD